MPFGPHKSKGGLRTIKKGAKLRAKRKMRTIRKVRGGWTRGSG